jgi:hypothetical protein
MATLLQRLPMIPRLTAPIEKAELMAHYYEGWDLLEADDTTGEILICKPSATTSEYTKSKHLVILYGEAAAAWRRSRLAGV